VPPRMPTSQVGDSPRVRFAHLALDAALNVAGVQGADAGPNRLCLTGDPPGGTLRGVSVIAQRGGRYSVDLCLVAGIVPLIELAAEVRRRVTARVAREGLGDQLGDVNVQFSEVLSAAEIAEQAARERAAQAAAQQVAAADAEHLDPVPRPRPEELLP
jgi:hypothetical protein